MATAAAAMPAPPFASTAAEKGDRAAVRCPACAAAMVGRLAIHGGPGVTVLVLDRTDVPGDPAPR